MTQMEAISTIVVLGILMFGALFVGMLLYASEIRTELRARNRETRQLLDRLTTQEAARVDPVVARMQAAMPASVKEAKFEVSGPLGAAFHEEVNKAQVISGNTREPREKSLKAHTVTRRIPLDMADEFLSGGIDPDKVKL